MFSFVVFGKSGCDLCKKRLDGINKIIKTQNIDAKVSYYDVKTAEGLVKFCQTNISEVPAVVLYENESEVDIVKYWCGSGKENLPTTRSILEAIGKTND